MAKRRHTPEQVIKKLREAEVALAERLRPIRRINILPSFVILDPLVGCGIDLVFGKHAVNLSLHVFG